MFRCDGPPRFTEFNLNHVKKIGGQMRTKKLLSAFAVMLFAFSVVAQEKPGTLAALEFQKPKNGMVTQYENGRKQKAPIPPARPDRAAASASPRTVRPKCPWQDRPSTLRAP